MERQSSKPTRPTTPSPLANLHYWIIDSSGHRAIDKNNPAMTQSPDDSISQFSCLRQQEFAFQPIQLRLVKSFSCPLRQCEGLSDCGATLFSPLVSQRHLS